MADLIAMLGSLKSKLLDMLTWTQEVKNPNVPLAQANQRANQVLSAGNPRGSCLTCPPGSAQPQVAQVNLTNPLNIIASDPPNAQLVERSLVFMVGGINKTLVRKTFGSAQSQCVDLIKDYAEKIYGTRPNVLGDGWTTAENFANLPNSTFTYNAAGSTTPPIVGAVISMSTLPPNPPDAALRSVEEHGHTGIIQSVQTNAAGDRMTVTVFDQNIPDRVGWKTANFQKSETGEWTGTWRNLGRDHSITGWANP